MTTPAREDPHDDQAPWARVVRYLRPGARRERGGSALSGTSTTKPSLPVLPVLAMLGETIVHAQDIRLPLGIPHDYPIQTLTRVADYYQGSDLPVLSKGRIKELRLAATDGPFSTGSGPLVAGTTLALTMAMAGRRAYCRRTPRRRCRDPAGALRDPVTRRTNAVRQEQPRRLPDVARPMPQMRLARGWSTRGPRSG